MKLTSRQQAFLDSTAAANSLGRHLALSINDRAARNRLKDLGLVAFDRWAGEFRVTPEGKKYVTSWGFDAAKKVFQPDQQPATK